MIDNDLHEFPVSLVEDIASRYRDFKISESVYDYTDMLIMARDGDLSIPKLHTIFIDEAQDLSTLQWILVNRMAEHAEHIVILGDDKQCQPAGSKVLTKAGYKNIEDLNEETDKLIVYSKNDSYCYGSGKREYSFKRKEHAYSGNIYTVNNSAKFTEGHICYVKWKDNTDYSKNAVYLMQKDDYFRVGWCQIFTKNGSFHCGERANKEKAEKLWILKVCDSKAEASMWESIYAAKYGLPLVPFETPHNTQYYTAGNIKFIFDKIPNQYEKAKTMLKDLNLDIRMPFWEQHKQSRYGCTIMELPMINVIPDMMLIPKMTSDRKVKWIPFTCTLERVEDITVYGLDVEKYHSYVTDDAIITHNCINEFAGADVETFLNLPGKVEVLEQSYRIPRRVFDLANKIMGNMTNYRKEGSNWKPRKEEGTCRNVQSIPYQHMISGDWLVLARTSYQLESIAQSLLQRTEDGALVFNINGSAPIDVDIFRVIEMMKLAELPGAQPLAELFQIKDTDTKEQRAQKIDYIKMFKKFIPHTPTKQPWEMCKVFREHLEMPWREAMERVPPYLKRYASRIYPLYKEKGESLFADASIRLMTVHAAKGREATNVLAIMDVPKSVKDTISNKETDVECKTLYVAVTRTKKNLYIYRANRYGIGLDIYL